MKVNEIVEKFKSIGFKEYEAKILVVLMKGFPISATEIAAEAKLVRTSIYDTLRSFVEKGYCNEIETNTIHKYQIINPEIIIAKVEKEYKELSEKRVVILKDTLGELKEHYSSTENGDINSEADNVEVIRGFNKNRVSKYIELIHSAKFEIFSMNRLKGLITDEINTFSRNFTKKGGVIRSLYKISLDFKVMKNGKKVNAVNDDLIKVCQMFESFGEEVKLTAIEIPNMVIVDREKIFLNIGEKQSFKNKQTDLIVNDKCFTENMRDLFENYWERSATVKEYQDSHKIYSKEK